jgi:hypothetical protein
LDWRQDDYDYSTRGDFSSSAGGTSADNGGWVLAKGISHHIFTNKNEKRGLKWTSQYIKLLSSHGVSGRRFLNSEESQMLLKTAREMKAHKGNGHSKSYHMKAFALLKRELAGYSGADALRAAQRAAEKMAKKIRKNPDILNQ